MTSRNFIFIVAMTDIKKLIPLLRVIKKVQGPVLLHVITQKGYKYSFRIFPTVTTFGKTACKYIEQMIKDEGLYSDALMRAIARKGTIQHGKETT